MPIQPPRIVPALHLKLADFAWELLSAEAERQGVSTAELAAHAVMYYLADLDSGRIAREPPAAESQPDRRTSPARRFRRSSS
jgi:hypothetical protein